MTHKVNDGKLVHLLALRAEDAEFRSGQLGQEAVTDLTALGCVDATDFSVCHIAASLLETRINPVIILASYGAISSQLNTSSILRRLIYGGADEPVAVVPGILAVNHPRFRPAKHASRRHFGIALE